IDVVINPHQATLGSILTHIRHGDVVRDHSLRRGAAEAIEAIAHGDKNNSKVIGRRIEEIDLPSGTNIGAIVRGNEVLMAHDDIIISPDDHLILFVVEKKRIRDVEKLFENTSRLF
ncbi:MAG: TrkA C-terminal domain-containing protein, partial [Pseudomonadota bacterium]|nr:TrkA C-terminal domain-containing protein [Pseudomonadota bacterium]